MIKTIVCGACGKMGSRLISLISQDKEMTVIGAVEEKNHPSINKTVLGDIVAIDSLERDISDAEVVITFTNPEASLKHLTVAAYHKKPIVIGTTGFTKDHRLMIEKLVTEIPCVLASNMSPGANLLFRLARETDEILPDYDVEIIEFHHNQKKDAPSGTALKLAEMVTTGLDDAEEIITRKPIFGRHGNVGPRKPEEIGIHAVRAGDIVGTHIVLFAGPGESIEIIHRAHSRDVFSHGAIKAAKWIIGKPAGLYDMQDVLGIK
jgi:4-hydroxy-tetrahydrodipicolinate reductase